MGIKCIVVIAGLVSGWMLFPETGISDRIFLKDGTVEESERIWTSEKFVHFILKGTQSVEIRYTIDIVDRVERDPDASGNTSTALETPRKEEVEKDARRPATPSIASPSTVGSPHFESSKETAALRRVEQESKGLSFYDPRRSLRYRVSKTSAYKDLKSALNELARLYGQSPDWIAAHMGEENDLQVIHRNLIGRRKLETASQATPLPEEQLSAAPGTAAPSGDPSTSEPESVSGTVSSRKRASYPELGIHKGIKFYDPRRPQKYWTGKTERHNSLQDALRSLARQYQVTPKWVEEHMGNSNLLIDIHERLINSLPQR